nr:MAG TPA: hypothetical protein [Caudoviricetes sp.]
MRKTLANKINNTCKILAYLINYHYLCNANKINK